VGRPGRTKAKTAIKATLGAPEPRRAPARVFLGLRGQFVRSESARVAFSLDLGQAERQWAIARRRMHGCGARGSARTEATGGPASERFTKNPTERRFQRARAAQSPDTCVGHL